MMVMNISSLVKCLILSLTAGTPSLPCLNYGQHTLNLPVVPLQIILLTYLLTYFLLAKKCDLSLRLKECKLSA